MTYSSIILCLNKSVVLPYMSFSFCVEMYYDAVFTIMILKLNCGLSRIFAKVYEVFFNFVFCWVVNAEHFNEF